MQRASSQTDTSVALYCFNASLYLLRVLKGNTAKKHQDGQMLQGADTKPEPKDPEVSQEPVRAVSRKLKQTLGHELVLSLLCLASCLTPALSPDSDCQLLGLELCDPGILGSTGISSGQA